MITAAAARLRNAFSTSAYTEIFIDFLTLQIKKELTNREYWIINLPVAIPLFNNLLPYTLIYLHTGHDLLHDSVFTGAENEVDRSVKIPSAMSLII